MVTIATGRCSSLQEQRGVNAGEELAPDVETCFAFVRVLLSAQLDRVLESVVDLADLSDAVVLGFENGPTCGDELHKRWLDKLDKISTLRNDNR